MRFFKPENKGYAVLFVVIIINAAALVIVTSIMIWGFYFHKTSLVNQKSSQARNIADACAEIALMDIWGDQNISGSYSESIGEGSCTYDISGTSPNKNIQVEASVDDVYRRLEVNIDQVNPDINISSWQEVADF